MLTQLTFPGGRLIKLAFFTLILTASLFSALIFMPKTAEADRHYGGNGPDSIPPHANCGPYVWGRAFVDGTPVANAVVTMSYLTSSVSITTMALPQFQNDGALYMFDARPCRKLNVQSGDVVTISVAVSGYPPQERVVRLAPNYANDEQLVDFYYGVQPIPFPTPLPQPLQPTTPINEMVSRHLLAAGAFHACTIAEGGLRCWGWNAYGQLGDGHPVSSANSVISRPAAVVGLTSGVKSVATGYRHTCAVLETGKVKCWGHNYIHGATGPTAPSVTSVPQDVPGITTAVDIVAGYFNTCVLLKDQTVMCWGDNDSGQLGNGAIGQSQNPTPTFVVDGAGQPLSGVTELAAKGWHVCAVVAGGVKCWGEMNGFNGLTHVGTPVDIVPAGSGVKTVGVGYSASCAATEDGSAYCWGTGLYPNSTKPVQISGLPQGIVMFALDRLYACALSSSGEVFCWGTGQQYQQLAGQFGVSATQPVTQPARIEGLTNAVDIAAGEEYVCARLADAKVQCWGSNAAGQLGNGETPTFPYPWNSPNTVTAYTGQVNAVAAGGFHSCAVNAGGGVVCWGANGYGQLGAGTFSHASPQAVPVSGLSAGVIAVTAGRQHSCALTSAGAVYCWGRNDSGQLGNESITHSSTPVGVAGLGSNVQAISAGEYHTCALLVDGTVRCWGSDWAGQLGDGTSGSYHAAPVAVTGLAGRAVAVGAGDDHTCAVIEGGAAQCWGLNTYGQLGNDSTVPSSTPVNVAGLTSGATAITGGRFSSCAVVNGGVKCWGSGDAGQLGDGVPFPATAHKSLVPVAVTGLTGQVVAIKAGGATVCARLVSNELACWGAGWIGQLGQGDANSRSSAVLVPLPPGSALQVDLTNEHVCAVLQDQSLRCWGNNVFGQVGTGVELFSPTPVDVLDIAPAQWTYMLYLAGDNDLSSFMKNISRALEKLPASTALNIVILFDGNGADDNYIWSTRDGGLGQYRLDEAESTTGSPATLAGFIAWARANFPAQHYYLSIADHGRATSGIAWDTGNGSANDQPDGLDPVELQQALSQATRQGAWKLDVIHFDACLMGLFEMGYQVKDYAHYMIASQNLTTAFYPYDEYSRVVLNNPTIAPLDLAKQIAGIYFNHDYLRLNQQPRTISVLNLDKIGSISSALNSLAAAGMQGMDGIKQAVAGSRDEVQVFDSSPDFKSSPPAYYTLTKEDEYVDLRDLARLVRDKSSVPTVTNAAGALFDALAKGDGNFVVDTLSESGTDKLVSGNEWDLHDANGISIFFPLAPGVWNYDRYVGNQLFKFTQDTQWDEFLQQYYAAISAEPVQPLDPGIPPVLRPTIPVTTHCEKAGQCLWGVVRMDGVPVEGAVVTLTNGPGAPSASTMVFANNEADPIYRFQLDDLGFTGGEQLVLTIAHAGVQTQRTLIYNPIGASGNREQQVDFSLSDPQQPSPPPSTKVAIVWAMVSQAIVKRDQQTVGLHALAVTNDNSSIVEYRWSSDRVEGSLGSSSSLSFPVAKLPIGLNKITVTAVSEAGVESEPVVLDLIVEEGQGYLLHLPLVRK